MDNFLITVVIVTIITKTTISEDLQHLNSQQENINPLNDHEHSDATNKDQDKRTIFNPTVSNYGWAKHVAVQPSGAKKLLGYSAIDLRYAPVLRPVSIKHQGYHYDKPKIHFSHRRPVVAVPVRPVNIGWRPVVKPVVPIHVPPPAPNHIIAKPITPIHIDHIHTPPLHVDHVHVKPDHVHVNTVPHLDQVHAVQFQHVHREPVGHVDHIHAIPAPVPVENLYPVNVHSVPVRPLNVQPLVPQQVVAQAPFVPSPLFEVTRPDLGVLPLGSTFPHPVLRDIPAPNSKPILPVQHVQPLPPYQTLPAVQPFAAVPHVHPLAAAPPVTHLHPIAAAAPVPHLHTVAAAPPVPHLHPVAAAQPVTHLHPVAQAAPAPHVHPIAAPPLYPPGTTTEYHGTINFLNSFRNVGLAPQVPVLPNNFQNPSLSTPQIPLNAAHPLLPSHFHLNYPQIPQQALIPHEQHDIQVPVSPNNPNIIQQHQFQQQLPGDGQSHFQDAGHNIFQQQLPVNGQPQYQDVGQNVFQQQSPNIPHQPVNNYPHDLVQDSQAPYQQADQVSHQYFQQTQNGFLGQLQPSDQSDNQGYVYQPPELANFRQSLQPGQTDLQFPLHLPHHPNLETNARQIQQSSQTNDSVFKPSIQLEPPYKK